MPRLIYAPKALNDLQEVKAYVAEQFGGDKAKACIKEITSTARQLEIFPQEGPCLEDIIEYPTDYRYLVVKPNPDKPEKFFLQFLHVSSTIKKNVGGCVHVTYG